MKTVLVALAWTLIGLASLDQATDDSWLQWSVARAEATAKAAYAEGRVGGWFDTRILSTDRAYNYKLAATWMHYEVVRATARVIQLKERLSDEEAKALVVQADAAGGFVVMVEIDPREGSGVIPNDWSVFLRPVFADGRSGRPTRGASAPKLRDVVALSGVRRRNYDYDRFWVVFPVTHPDGAAVLPSDAAHAELVVRIAGNEGRVRWPIPTAVRTRSSAK
jgi:hypothetical protein